MATSSTVVFQQCVADYSDALYSWAYYKTSSKETAEDLVQDTFMAAFHKIDSFEGKSQPKTWLLSILNNKIIDYYRKNAKVSTRSIEQERIVDNSIQEFFNEDGHWNPELDVHEEHWLDNPEFNKILAACIQKLPTNWQYAVQAKYIETQKSEDICDFLEINPTNYWQIIHRSKLALRQCIEKQWLKN